MKVQESKQYTISFDECYSLFGAIEMRIKYFEKVLDSDNSKKFERELAENEIKNLNRVRDELGF